MHRKTLRNSRRRKLRGGNTSFAFKKKSTDQYKDIANLINNDRKLNTTYQAVYNDNGVLMIRPKDLGESAEAFVAMIYNDHNAGYMGPNPERGGYPENAVADMEYIYDSYLKGLPKGPDTTRGAARRVRSSRKRRV